MMTRPAYSTGFGAAYCGDSLALLSELPGASVNLVVTSPPFALQQQKAYGNKDQAEYIEWLAQFARQVYRVLKEDGSFVASGVRTKRAFRPEASTIFAFSSVSAMRSDSISRKIFTGSIRRSFRARLSG